ncbi:DUF1624 domain-containing protein [Candidatus Bathyarchaeota archaeon]|nr:DUF1624 domain-containing protein [Candidatus Bathyarchaeota archaeon]
MTSSTSSHASRLPFIDFTRGIVMVLMAWDHVSGFWNPGKMGSEGLRGYFPYVTDINQFYLRLITHVCAPTFIFLAGTSMALSTRKRLHRGEDQWSISKRMATRGMIMWLLAIYIVGPAFGSGPLYFGVLACFGACFILWSLLRRLPTPAILVGSLMVVLFHPYLNLDFIRNQGLGFYLRVIIHEPASTRLQWPFGGLYPIIPWIGVMGLGWMFGVLISSLGEERIHGLKTPLLIAGASSWILFAAVRWMNGFGVLVPRSGDTLVAWLSVSKYPPSLAFLLFTLGEMFLILALGLHLQDSRFIENGIVQTILLFGKTPLFFYIAHLVLYRIRPFWMTQPRFYDLNLWEAGGFWIIGLVILRWFCSYYLDLKKEHPRSILQYI